MTTTQIIMLVAVLAVIAMLVVRVGGPRVTHIDRKKTEQEKEIEDRDDA